VSVNVPESGLQHVLPAAGPAKDPTMAVLLTLALPATVALQGRKNAIENEMSADPTVPVSTGPPAFGNVAVKVQRVWVTTTGPLDVNPHESTRVPV
jgi:hypothetical protein